MNMADKAKAAPLRGSRAKFLVLVLIVVICVLLFLFNKERNVKKQLIKRKDFMNTKFDESELLKHKVKGMLDQANGEISALKKQLEEAKTQVDASLKETADSKALYATKETEFKELEAKAKETQDNLDALKKVPEDKTKEAAAKEAAAKEAVAKEAVAKEAVAKEAVAKEAAAKEAVAKEAAAKPAATTLPPKPATIAAKP